MPTHSPTANEQRNTTVTRVEHTKDQAPTTNALQDATTPSATAVFLINWRTVQPQSATAREIGDVMTAGQRSPVVRVDFTAQLGICTTDVQDVLNKLIGKFGFLGWFEGGY
jgi:hypothetical protein